MGLSTFGVIFFTLFLILKLTSTINWSWWLVTSPLWLILVDLSIAYFIIRSFWK